MEGLRTVWKNCANKAKRRCRMVMRFGAINDRKDSLGGTGWRLQTCRRAGSASAGRRQAGLFVNAKGPWRSIISGRGWWSERRLGGQGIA